MSKLIIKQILSSLKFVDFLGDENQEINRIDKFDVNNKSQDTIFWCNDKNLKSLYELNYGTVICSDNVERARLKQECNYIIVENPRSAFQQIMELFFVEEVERKISESAIIDSTALIGNNVYIGENVVVEANCKVGNNSIINHNTVVMKDTVIGNNVLIGANCTIGGIGFGYEKDIDGKFRLIPHIGNVILKDDVEIGNNVCIDRAVMGSTILRVNVKVDNLVHIAHGVDIGENSVIIANAMIAGSVKIGENTWVAPSASVLNQKSIGNDALVGIGAVVLKDVDCKSVVVGNPAKPIGK